MHLHRWNHSLFMFSCLVLALLFVITMFFAYTSYFILRTLYFMLYTSYLLNEFHDLDGI